MPRFLPAVSIVFLILLCLLGMIFGWIKYFDYQQKEAKIASFHEYYRGLARGCYEKDNVSCCLSSVSSMQTKKALLIPENGCPKDTKQGSLRCQSTYTWCEVIPTPVPAS